MQKSREDWSLRDDLWISFGQGVRSGSSPPPRKSAWRKDEKLASEGLHSPWSQQCVPVPRSHDAPITDIHRIAPIADLCNITYISLINKIKIKTIFEKTFL